MFYHRIHQSQCSPSSVASAHLLHISAAHSVDSAHATNGSANGTLTSKHAADSSSYLSGLTFLSVSVAASALLSMSNISLNNFRLSFPTVSSMTLLATSVWIYFWSFYPGKPMRDRRAQTWWQLGGYLILLSYGWWRAHVEGLLTVYRNVDAIWYSPLNNNESTKFHFELEVAWYLSSLICTIVNCRAKDFLAMFFHHIITPITVYSSWHFNYGYAAVGLYIMVLHDVSDVFLHIAKTLQHEGIQRGADFFFAIFTVVFFISRLVLLPMVPYSWFISSAYPSNEGTGEWWGTAMNTSLVLLVCLHVYWFSLILQIIINVFRGKDVSDIRDENDGQTAKPSKTKTAKLKLAKGNGHTNGVH